MEYVTYIYAGEYVYPLHPGMVVITSGGTFKGEGNMCGWYGQEYMMDIQIIGEVIDGKPVMFEKPFNVEKLPIHSTYSQGRISL